MSAVSETSNTTGGSDLKVTFTSIKEEVFKNIYSRISLRPSDMKDLDKTNTELKSFQFRIEHEGDREKILVCLPRNLEAYADNWICIAAVGAIASLNATIVPSMTDSQPADLKIREQALAYLQGVASVFKENHENGAVAYRNYTGAFQQGRMWTIANKLQYHKNKELFRLAWNNPYHAITGQSVWNKGLVSGEIQRFVNLLCFAGRRLNIADYQPFLKSPQQVINEKFKHSFNYESAAVFSPSEIDYMKSQASPLKGQYDKFIDTVRNDMISIIDRDLDKEYTAMAKGLVEYDRKISQIAQYRAKFLFAELNARREVKNAKRGFSREERLAMLTLDKQIACLNPTGLGVRDVVRPIVFPKNLNEDETLEFFRDWSFKVRPQLDHSVIRMFDDWVLMFVPPELLGNEQSSHTLS